MNIDDNMNIDDKLLKLRKMVESLKIPNLMNASEGSLKNARQLKNEIIKEISSIRKLLCLKG